MAAAGPLHRRGPRAVLPGGHLGPALAQVDEAKAICGGCAVRADCLEWSLATYQDAGVWGGLDEEERRDDPTRTPAARPAERVLQPAV